MRQKQNYRRGFPDFMDMMITCADAGMSLEAAVERVSNELAGTHKWLGIQLAIMTLQLRAGKPLREALRELADRIGLDEARALAVLFRQSEELGTSLTDALRVYSDEMRSAENSAGGREGQCACRSKCDPAGALHLSGRDDDRHAACDHPDEGYFLLGMSAL